MNDVVIAGAGPVGMTAAVLLAREGLKITVLEAGDDLASHSRASTWHPPTLELLDIIGVADQLVKEGLKVGAYQYRSKEDGLIAEMDMSLLKNDTKFPFRMQLEQSVFTRVMQQELRRLGVEITFNAEVTGVTVEDDGAVVETKSGETYKGKIVLGADGASSPTRKSLGIEFSGMTYDEKFLTITSTFPLGEALPDFAPVSYVADAEDWLVLLQVPNGWRVLVPTEVDLEMGTQETTELLSRKMNAVAEGAGEKSEYEWTVYRVHQRVASTLSKGPVALIGDAGHVNSPIGGMGMNSGIHDAFDVALGALESIKTGDLTYLHDAAERRRRFAVDYVQAATVANTKSLTMKEGTQERQNNLREIAKDQEKMYKYVLHSSMIEGSKGLVDYVRSRLSNV